jgi:hypothetical protein
LDRIITGKDQFRALEGRMLMREEEYLAALSQKLIGTED